MNARHRYRRDNSRGRSAAADLPESTATLRIDSIASGGAGVGRADGLACFVQRTAPGDVAQVALKKRGRFATGRLLQLIELSSDRVEPRCHHYVVDRCGGCQLQHMSAPAQRDTKSQIVRDALQRIARRNVASPLVEAGPRDWEYRRRLTLTLIRKGSRWVGGLHPYDDPVDVFALRECPISHPLLVESWNAVDAISELLPKADTLRVAFRLLDDSTVAVVIVGGTGFGHSRDFVLRLAATPSPIRDVWWERDPGDRVQLMVGGTVPDTAARQSDAEGNAETRANALAFVQVNAAVAAMLRDHVALVVEARRPQRVLDAYAGSGLLAERLGRSGLQVTAIEIDPEATRRAEERVQELSNVRIVTGGVESLIPDVIAEAPPDVIIVNPPRRGLEASLPQMLDETIDVGTRCIVYISCDPATLSRDLSALTHWRVTELRCFDMFPQTAHVETVCVLEPESVA